MNFFRTTTFKIFLGGFVIALAIGSMLTYSLWHDNPYDELVNPVTNQVNIDSLIISVFVPVIFWTLLFIIAYAIVRLVKILVR